MCHSKKEGRVNVLRSYLSGASPCVVGASCRQPCASYMIVHGFPRVPSGQGTKPTSRGNARLCVTTGGDLSWNIV